MNRYEGFNILKIHAAMGYSLEYDEIFYGWEGEPEVASLYDVASLDYLLLKRQHSEGEVHRDTGLIVNQQQNAVSSGELFGILYAG